MEGGQERWAFKRNTIAIWLVVLTILKNISQWEGLSHIMEHKTCLKPPTSHWFQWTIGTYHGHGIGIMSIFDGMIMELLHFEKLDMALGNRP